MTDFQPVSAQELPELMHILANAYREDSEADGSTDASPASETKDKPAVQSQDCWTTVVEITQPNPYVYTACVRLDEDADIHAWTGTNVGFRAELPIKPLEFTEITEAPEQASRVYTVAGYSIEERTVSFDLVVHQDDSPGMRWATTAQPGDRLFLRAPHTYKDPVEGPHRLIIADSAALPAAKRIILSQDYAGETTLLTSGHPEELAVLSTSQRLTIERVEQPLDEVFLTLDLSPFSCIWGAGEARVMRVIRQHSYQHTELSKDNIMITGYWKGGQSLTQRDITALRITRDTLAAGGTVDEAVEIFSQQQEA